MMPKGRNSVVNWRCSMVSETWSGQVRLDGLPSDNTNRNLGEQSDAYGEEQVGELEMFDGK